MVRKRITFRRSTQSMHREKGAASGSNGMLRRHIGRLAQPILAAVLVMMMLGCENLLGESGDDGEDGNQSPLSVLVGAPSYDETDRLLTFNNVSLTNVSSDTVFDAYIWFFISQDGEVGNGDDIFVNVLELTGFLDAGETLPVPNTLTETFIPEDIGGTWRIAVVATQTENPSTFSGSVHPHAVSTETFSPTRTALAVRVLLNSDGTGSQMASEAEMVLNNDYLYIASNGGGVGYVHSLNVSNPAGPTAGPPVSSLNPLFSKIAVNGTSLYVGGSSSFSSNNDLVVYDITNPASPSSPNEIALTNGSGGDEMLDDLAVDPTRNRLYTFTSTGFAGYDTTTDLSSKLFFETSIDTDSSTSALFSNGYVFAFSDGIGLDSYTAVLVDDDTIDTTPGTDVTQTTDTAFDSTASDISGTTVAIADTAALPDAIQLVNVTDPTAPITIDRWSLQSSTTLVNDVAIDGNFVYVAHSAGVFVYDITDTSNVRLVSEFSLLGNPGIPARAVYLDTNTAYVIHSLNLSGIDNDATFFVALNRSLYETGAAASIQSQSKAAGTTAAPSSYQEELFRFVSPIPAPSDGHMWKQLR